MRILDAKETELVGGGKAAWKEAIVEERAAPATDVTPDLPGNRTGWCRGYGNMKGGEPKHAGTDCGLFR